MTTSVDSATRVIAAMMTAERSKKWTATKAGFSYSTFERKLNRGGDFTMTELARIANALNCTPMDLLPDDFRGGH